MPTESVPLQPLEEEDGDKDEGNTDPPEDGIKISTKSSRKVQYWKRTLNTVVSLLGYTTLYAGIAMIAPFYPILADSRGVAAYIVGFVLATAALSITVMSPIIGVFLPHLGLKFTLLAGLFLAGGSLALFGFVSKMPTPATFLLFSFLLRVTEGIGTAMFSTGSYTLLTQLHASRKGTIVGLMELSMGFGTAIGAPIGGGLQEVGGFTLPFVVVGGCVIVLILFLVVIVHPTECASNTLSCRLASRLLSNKMVVVLVLTFLITNSVVSAVLSYLGSFISSQFNLRVGVVGAVYLAGAVVYGSCTVVAGLLTDRLVPRYLILAGLIVGLVPTVLIGPAYFITAPTLWLTVPAFALFGAVMPFAIVPVYLDIYNIATQGHTPEEEEAIASTLSGVMIASMSIGNTFGPIIGGVMVYKVGFQSMTSILSLPLFTNAVVLSIATVIQKCCKGQNIATVIQKCCKGRSSPAVINEGGDQKE